MSCIGSVHGICCSRYASVYCDSCKDKLGSLKQLHSTVVPEQLLVPLSKAMDSKSFCRICNQDDAVRCRDMLSCHNNTAHSREMCLMHHSNCITVARHVLNAAFHALRRLVTRRRRSARSRTRRRLPRLSNRGWKPNATASTTSARSCGALRTRPNPPPPK